MNVKSLRPVGRKLLIELLPVAAQTATGIHFAPAYEQPRGRAKVLAVGAQCEHVKPGDMVAFSWINGVEIDNHHKIITEQELLGVLQY